MQVAFWRGRAKRLQAGTPPCILWPQSWGGVGGMNPNPDGPKGREGGFPPALPKPNCIDGWQVWQLFMQYFPDWHRPWKPCALVGTTPSHFPTATSLIPGRVLGWERVREWWGRMVIPPPPSPSPLPSNPLLLRLDQQQIDNEKGQLEKGGQPGHFQRCAASCHLSYWFCGKPAGKVACGNHVTVGLPYYEGWSPKTLQPCDRSGAAKAITFEDCS